jgi:hypothetical protein
MVKMANKRKRTKKGRSKKSVIHAIPAILEAGGVVLPAIVPTDQGYPSPFESVVKYKNPQDAMNNLMSNVKNDWKDMATLIIGGMVLKYVGKKTGLNKVGTKEVRLL